MFVCVPLFDYSCVVLALNYCCTLEIEEIEWVVLNEFVILLRLVLLEISVFP